MKADVCYVISHGYSARMLFHSGVAAALKERNIRLAVIAPTGMSGSLMPVAERYDVAVYEAEPLPPGVEQRYEFWRRYLSPELTESDSLWERHLRSLAGARRAQRLKLRAGLVFNLLARRSRVARRVLEWIGLHDIHRPDVYRILERIRPHVVVSTFPVLMLEAAVLAAARQLRVQTIGHILSWDNITSKGHFPVPPDRYLAWGPVMTDELVSRYGCTPGAVTECGVAHFDAHVTGVSPEGTRAALLDLGLDPERPFLFFTMLMPLHSPHELDIVERLAEAVKEGRFGEAMQLVVRPHPQSVSGPYAADQAWQARLAALGGDGVAVDIPRVHESAMPWSFHEDDLLSLANLLAGASVCLNSGSTLTLEALIHDCPVVLTLFDGDVTLPPHKSIRRVARYTHLAKLIAFGAARVVGSFDELYAAVEAYLRDPSGGRAARAAAARAEMGPVDGRASERIAEALAQSVGAAVESPSGVGLPMYANGSTSRSLNFDAPST